MPIILTCQHTPTTPIVITRRPRSYRQCACRAASRPSGQGRYSEKSASVIVIDKPVAVVVDPVVRDLAGVRPGVRHARSSMRIVQSRCRCRRRQPTNRPSQVPRRRCRYLDQARTDRYQNGDRSASTKDDNKSLAGRRRHRPFCRTPPLRRRPSARNEALL